MNSTNDKPSVHLGSNSEIVSRTLQQIDADQVVRRIWKGDHTVWKPDPREITDRLGWLTLPSEMQGRVPALNAFADEVRHAGYRHVVLLGMGGSSLGPEVLRQTFGKVNGYPGLIVLDSTVPAWIKSVTGAIDPARTLFVVSSKSGTTIEPNTLYRYFRGVVEREIGEDKAGANFIAVTDPGTPLEELGKREEFRRVFTNQPDIGGRYSVLSYFGLVPAALTGVDVDELLKRADEMAQQCATESSVMQNPGAHLGAIIGSLVENGRDKLSLVTSPSIDSFGLWVEQLIAESTGKGGTGIVPIAYEPVLSPEQYGDNRVFVYLRVDGDDNDELDSRIDELENADYPVIVIKLKDIYELGAEFFRWEFATAVAGSILGIQPFDQPNVQAAKDATSAVLDEFGRTGAAPDTSPTGSFDDFMRLAKPGDYLAILAYLHPTPETDEAFAAFRRSVMGQHQIATTVGYGPRYLHSTGQLHKGGPDTGLFLQITSEHTNDIAIPGERFSFGILADAQAAGDFQALKSLGRRVVRVNASSIPGLT